MIKLYRYDILAMSNDEYACLALTLPDDRLRRIDRMQHIGDRKRALAGHLLILGAAKELCGVRDPKILRTDAGKPYFADLPVKFNLSHSEERVILAVSDREIGADIQRMRPTNLRLAKRFFTQRENEYIFGKAPSESDFNTPKEEQSDELLSRFYEIWTKKEALGKQRGCGVAAVLGCEVLDLRFYTENDGEYALAVYE